MKILFVSSYGHLPESCGGLQTSIDALCRRLPEHGSEAALLCCLDGEGAAAPADSALPYPVLRVADPVAALDKAIRRFRPDLLLLLSGPRLVPLIVASLGQRLPIAVYLHNVEFDKLGGVLLGDERLCYLANSPFTAARLAAMFGIDSTVVEPLIPQHRYVTETSRARALFINPTLLKGVELVLRLAHRLPHIPLSIVESWHLDAPWRDYCRSRLAALPHVEWHAATPDMRWHLARTRLLLMPSVWEESYGRMATEAQLCGIPVLASDRGNLPETVGEGGRIVPLHAPLAAWEAALEALWRPGPAYEAAAAAAHRHARRAEIAEDALLDRFTAVLAQHIARLAALA